MFRISADLRGRGIRVTVLTHPVPGTIVPVDLSDGFKPPEMVKRRPCIVLSPQVPGRSFLCTVVTYETRSSNDNGGD